MTAESERGASDPGIDNEATPDHKITRDKPIQPEDTPEVLRWRADSLLDEMMLGAVDVSAADSDDRQPNEFRGSGDAPGSLSDTDNDRHQPAANGLDLRRPGNGNYTNPHSQGDFAGAHTESSRPAENWTRSSDPPLAADLNLRQNGFGPDDDSPRPTPTPEWRVKSGGGDGNDDSTWNEYVSSFRTSGESSAQIQKWQPDSPAGGNERDFYGPSYGSADDRGSTRNADTPAAPQNPDAPSAGTDDRSGAGYVSAMAVMPRSPRRSSLLPRMSRFDVDALNREIADLHEDIRALLPVGHDQAERARHLLDKAYTIAESDPQRSAEVEYYMQQVRTIVERNRQARRWSNLYRDRLRTYLLAWTLLSALILTALLLFQFQIELYVAGALAAAEDGLLIRNFAGALGSMMAGALGGALGALFNMRKHSRTQYGFFDRKYGLRGLMLPVIGALVGLILYSLFATVYYFAGINPSLSAVAMALPALIAFGFGFSQESVYGTNG
jgi:hypothetical protein